jgi:hypothetical protein
MACPSLPGLPTKRHNVGRRNRRARCSRRTGFFPPSQHFVIGPALSPDFAHLRGAAGELAFGIQLRVIARRTPAGCGVTKHVLVAHVPEPKDPDGVTELVASGHVSATM